MKRTPLARKTRIRRVAKKRAGSPKSIRKELDALARAFCMRAAGNRCEKCGKTQNLQWHHVYSRRYLTLRWEPLNLLILCAGCHLWWHHNPLDAVQWFVEKFGAARYSRLQLIRQTRTRQDLGALLVWLRAHTSGTPESP